MITIEQLNEAIEAYGNKGNISYTDLMGECEDFLKFIEFPYESFSIVSVLKMTKFFLDKESIRKLNTKLNNKAFW